MEKLIEVFNLGGLPTAPLDSFLELQEDFKKSDPDKLSKLQMLIITRGFKYAFKAWKILMENSGLLMPINGGKLCLLCVNPVLPSRRFHMNQSSQRIKKKQSRK